MFIRFCFLNLNMLLQTLFYSFSACWHVRRRLFWEGVQPLRNDQRPFAEAWIVNREWFNPISTKISHFFVLWMKLSDCFSSQTTVIVNAMLLFHRYFQFELLEHKGDYPKDKSLVPYVRNSKVGPINDSCRQKLNCTEYYPALRRSYAIRDSYLSLLVVLVKTSC